MITGGWLMNRKLIHMCTISWAARFDLVLNLDFLLNSRLAMATRFVSFHLCHLHFFEQASFVPGGYIELGTDLSLEVYWILRPILRWPPRKGAKGCLFCGIYNLCGYGWIYRWIQITICWRIVIKVCVFRLGIRNLPSLITYLPTYLHPLPSWVVTYLPTWWLLTSSTESVSSKVPYSISLYSAIKIILLSVWLF